MTRKGSPALELVNLGGRRKKHEERERVGEGREFLLGRGKWLRRGEYPRCSHLKSVIAKRNKILINLYISTFIFILFYFSMSWVISVNFYMFQLIYIHKFKSVIDHNYFMTVQNWHRLSIDSWSFNLVINSHLKYFRISLHTF